MLHHRLRGIYKPIQFVGYKHYSNNPSASAVELTFSSLTGGIDTSAKPGDLVIVSYAYEDCAQADMNSTGYTLMAELTEVDAADSKLVVFKKIITNDISVNVGVNYGDWASINVYVWRNASFTTQITTATGTSTGRPNPPSITPTKAGSKIMVIGSASTYGIDNNGAFTAPSGISSFISADNDDDVLGVGYYDFWTSGAYDCASFNGGNTSTGSCWCAASLVIQPAF